MDSYLQSCPGRDAMRKPYMTRTPCILALLALLGWMLPTPAGAEILARQNGVVVERASTSGPWTLTNGVMRLTIGFDARRVLFVKALALTTSDVAIVEPSQEAPLTINGQQVTLSNAQQGTRLLGAAVTSEGNGLRLDLTFSSSSPAARITRSYACHPLVPVVEVWTAITVSQGGTPLTIESPTIWRLSTSERDVAWLRGLRGPEDSRGGFSLERQSVGAGESLRIEATGRSTESAFPWFAATRDQETVFGGLMWSGRWAITVDGQDQGALVSLLLPDVSIQVTGDRPFTSPRGFFGIAAGTEASVASAMRAFLIDVVREGRGFEPLVTYNTWFGHGTRVDAHVVARAIESASRMGVELFQLDAGWYEGSKADGFYDFDHGLGTWRADAERFPDGIRPLVDLAHERGMRFGLWVEPERVDLATLGRPDSVQEAWLATSGGRYRPDVAEDEEHTAQICLAHPEARQWVIDQLIRLVEEYGVDYIKWDNNAWLLCDREGHGHGASDGDVAHVQGLYAILAELRTRYPSLLIENCSGGGARIDLGLARYTDVGWMDDRSAPSLHVRHNLQGLSTVLPPAYLLSYAMSGGGERLDDEDDLGWLTRSRMFGVLGLSYRDQDLDDDAQEALAREVETYKRVRTVVRGASAALLTEQVSEASAPSWDATMAVTTSGDAVLFAFQNDGTAERFTVFPVLLLPDVEYEVVSIDGRVFGRATGSALMESGIELQEGGSHARVLLLTPQGQ